MDIYMGGEGGGGGVEETTVDVLLEGMALHPGVSDSREEAPALIDRVFPDGAMDHVVDVYLRSKNPSESRDPHRDGRGGAGFYKVPADVRQQAGTAEAVLLYDPKYVNFRKISDLLLQEQQEQQPDRSAQRQLSHYRYHLHSYVYGRKWETKESRMQRLRLDGCKKLVDEYRETTESFMQLLDDYQKYVNNKFRNLDPEECQLLWVDPPVSMVPQSLGLLFAVSFLLDLFSGFSSYSFSASEDPECAQSWATELWSDLLLLENQIPLFRLACLNTNLFPVLFRRMASYFADFIPLNDTEFSCLADEIEGVNRDRSRYLHVLHFVHEMLLPSVDDGDDSADDSNSSDDDDDDDDDDDVTIGQRLWRGPCRLWRLWRLWRLRWLWWRRQRRRRRRWSRMWRMKPIPTVSRLVSAGVEFKLVDKEGFAVEFKKGVLKLPRLLVSQSMKKMLANLIAWEKYHDDAPNYFINYAIFMDHLINTAKDVEILIQSKVFEHSLATDDEVKTTFDGLGQGLIYTKPKQDHERYDIFPKLTVDIVKYYQSRPNKWLANLMQEYFKSPWTIISFIAALFLILLTAVQTFFSVYPYARPH